VNGHELIKLLAEHPTELHKEIWVRTCPCGCDNMKKITGHDLVVEDDEIIISVE
jgi:hypothetical protein